MALGFWQGLFWAQLGTLIGNYILFVVARAVGGEWLRHVVRKRVPVSEKVFKKGMAGVILARQLPVPGVVVNLGFGLVSVRHRDFLLGTLIGQLPQAIPCTLIGAGALKSSFALSLGWFGVAVVLAVLLWAGLKKWLSRSRLQDQES